MSKNWEEKFRTEDLQRLRGFRLMDDDFMSKCFEENIECTELVLHIVLGRDDLKVKKVETQHFMKNLQGRSIILDITQQMRRESGTMWKSRERIVGQEQREPDITVA